MSSILERARPEILRLKPYVSARASIADAEDFVRLDANELPWPAFPDQAESNRYPEPQPRRLVARLASIYGVRPEQVLVTRGADEAIDILVRVFCRPIEDAVVISPPTFGFYRVAAEIQGAQITSVPRRDDFILDWSALDTASEEDAVKIAFVCTPNNPTANVEDTAALLAFVKRHPERIVVVDEAYAEFSSTPSLSAAVSTHPNLVVLRTLSKAFGLAGVRCGVAIAQSEILGLMRRVLAPYPIPRPTAESALSALTPHGLSVMRERVGRLVLAREELRDRLTSFPDIRRVYPSETNFILLEVEKRGDFVERLRSSGILVRAYGETLPDHVRLTVGSEDENRLVLDALGLNPPKISPDREAATQRSTRETQITVSVNLERADHSEIETGIGFYDHMLEQVAKHGGFGLRLCCKGDLEVDAHHTVEDCALALGEVLRKAIGDKRGIGRYGFTLPMDEARAEVLLDLSGRPASVFEGQFSDIRVGGLSVELVPHFFESLAVSLGAAIHVRVEGKNTHHMVESSFKGLGRALRQAIRRTGEELPSTKGTL